MSHMMRFIVVKTSPERAPEIERVWTQECSPLMRKLPGCLHEGLLRSVEEPGEYISITEWASQEAIDGYLASPEHQEIKRHTRGITEAAATVKTYELVGLA